MTTILGISAFYHDSAAALLVDGEIVAAVQEERFTRKKYDARLPIDSIDYCLKEAGLGPKDIDYVVFYDKPIRKFDRLLETYLSFAPQGFHSFAKSMPVWLKDKLYMGRKLAKTVSQGKKVVYLSHHESHAASAFFPSPFDEAAILTMDGVGEWVTTSTGVGRGNKIELQKSIQFPHSLGLLYSAFTYYCGFEVNSGEYKLMGLAPYGSPVYSDLILEKLIRVKPDGSFWLDMSYFNFCQGLTMTSTRFHKLFGKAPRKPAEPIEKFHQDLAASVQKVTEQVVLAICETLQRETGQKNLVLAGGVALNCVANGKILRESKFENVWIQPAAGDAGGALGAAYFTWHQLLEKKRTARDTMQGAFLGPQFSTPQIRKVLDEAKAKYTEYAEPELLDKVADLLAQGKIVGWFQGRAEWGPRALGARSILGDPRSITLQSDLNIKTKFRENFRPFAPSILREHVHEWFQMRENEDSPYMLLICPVKENHRQTPATQETDLLDWVKQVRSNIPAVTHVDYSARVQTIDARHGRYHRLLRAFHQKTGCPVLVNTSFNMSWEPIVNSPEEAYRSFMQSGMDVLVLENCVLLKSEQPLGIEFETVETNPLADPLNGDALEIGPKGAVNRKTGTVYPVENGIPNLFQPTDTTEFTDVTSTVQQFYEKTPFPNYDAIDNTRALLDKARKGRLASLLNEQIPYGASVLEVGCGTGQLTNFLSIANRSVLGIDVCLNSLKLAQDFKEKNQLTRASFAQMNLFRPALKENFFDYVISNGVLHHTGDCKRALQSISRLVKPGGVIIIGLYNLYSRGLLHYPRVALHRWTGLSPSWMDPQYQVIKAGKAEAWLQDQYHHPHETCHTLDQVMDWFKEFGFDFVNSIPKPVPGNVLAEKEALFTPIPEGNAWSRVWSQLSYLKNGFQEGGFFTMIGRKSHA